MKEQKPYLGLWIALAIFAAYVGVVVSNLFDGSKFIPERLESLQHLFFHPWSLVWSDMTPVCILGTMAAWLIGLLVWLSYASQARMPGKEYGGAKWQDWRQFNKKYMEGKGTVCNLGNRILSEHVRVSNNARKTGRNNNQIVLGGSGAGKTAFVLSPNLLNNLGESSVITDPKGAILKDYGNYLIRHGIEVQTLNLCDMEQSMRYNPLEFVRDSVDVSRLAHNIFDNVDSENKNTNADPFWDASATTLLEAILFYIWMECPRIDSRERVLSTKLVMNASGGYTEIPDQYETEYRKLERDFTSILVLADECRVSDDPLEKSPMDQRMEKLAAESPQGEHHPAYIRYQRCWKGAADTKRSILSVLYSKISRFDNPKLLNILSGNDLQLLEMGMEKKIALFIIIPETDKTYNFLPGILYTQIFQQLFDAARAQDDNRLKIPVNFWLDEFLNIPMPTDFLEVLATARQYGCNISILIQALAGIKGKYDKERWESIVSNCDTMIYLGGNEHSTFKYLTEMLGKWTIQKQSMGVTRGTHGSSSKNTDILGRELMTPDEVRMLPNEKEIILYRGEYPILDTKMKCWTMTEWKEAKGYGMYRYHLEEEEITDLKNFLNCKGERLGIREMAVDLMEFLKYEFSKEDQGKDAEILEELCSEEAQAHIREYGKRNQEEANIQEAYRVRMERYQNSEDLLSYVLQPGPGGLTDLQKEYVKKATGLGIPEERILKIINPGFDKEQMEQALETTKLLQKES